MLIICDIDGTVANCSHRISLIPDWDAFHEGMKDDPPIKPVIALVRALLMAETPIGLFFLTGRPEKYRFATKVWIRDRMELFELDHYDLIMRPDDDYSPDVEFKARAFTHEFFHGSIRKRVLHRVSLDEQYIKDNAVFLEDRDHVVEMWRGKGYCCLQPREGEY